MSSEILDLSAAELADAIVGKQTTSTAATKAYLNAIEKFDGRLQAYNELYADRAMQRAAEIDAKISAGQNAGLLGGVPIAIKDNLCTTWGHTTCSSKYLKDFKAPYTATAVERLENAGAVILGKTNLDEFAMGSSTENSGFHVSRNPWDVQRVPGGSSGGSAAAVAGRLCAAALGSDTGGSIRQPASFCGIVGCKPTYGRISRYGLVAFGSSLDQIGPMTRNVRDAALLTQVMAGNDSRDATSLPNAVPDYAVEMNAPVKGLKIGLPKEFYTSALGGEVRESIEKAIEVYKSLGAEMVEVALPHSRIDIDAAGNLSSYAVACYYIVCTAECCSNLARFDGVHYGHRTQKDVSDIVELYCKSRAEALGDEVKRRIMLGNYALSSGYYDAYYNKALKVRRLIADDFTAAFKQCDVLLCPTSPTTAFKFGEKSANPIEMYMADIYTISLNLAGLPGISIPCGMDSNKMPIGMQLIGPVLSEGKLFSVAGMYEKAAGFDAKPAMIS